MLDIIRTLALSGASEKELAIVTGYFIKKEVSEDSSLAKEARDILKKYLEG